MQHPALEIIAFDIETCLQLQQTGIHRVELCADPGNGGTTPSAGLIAQARKVLQKELYVMIRPRGGDFVYSSAELDCMLADIAYCKQVGIDGVVFGALHADRSIHVEQCRILVDAADGMGITFHRAFDRVLDPQLALSQIIDLGIKRILSSGLAPTASQGKALLRALVKQAGQAIEIMPGSGVRAATLPDLLDIGASAYHSSAAKQVPAKHQGIGDEQLQYNGVDLQEIEQMLAILNS
jgi:copper homeostasis protein